MFARGARALFRNRHHGPSSKTRALGSPGRLPVSHALLHCSPRRSSAGCYVVRGVLAANSGAGTEGIDRAGQPLGSSLRRPYTIRTQLLLMMSALMAIAWVVGRGVTILHARKATHIEINAAMELAAALVRDAIPFVQQSNSPDRALASIPDQVSSVRHVRISVTS